ncbi:MAG: heavy-metal-associated domain-containing protein [Bernardetiaceae bacterium]|jgi:copper chaperone CopZ|nr:heavy-metal-associated domain-containing protein [Bernardetiaceae bacterium]
MKISIWLMALALVGAFSLRGLAQTDVKEVKIKTSAQCDMCKKRIEKAIGLEKGVKTAVLDVKSKVLTVQYRDGKTNPEALRSAVTKVGYDADVLPADKKAHDRLPDCCQKGGHDGKDHNHK